MTKDVRLYMVLDANILIKDFWATSPAFRYLRKYRFLSHRPVIPNVAYLEARNRLKARAEELIANGKGVRRSPGNRERLLRLFNLKRMPVRDQWSVDGLLRRWDRHIAGILDEASGFIAPEPDLAIGDMVTRSIERRKPFSKGDRGFRDTVIWLTTLNLISDKTRISFVTENTQDFFDSDGLSPHPEILREASLRLGESYKILFHKSLDEFIAHFDADKSASAEALERALTTNDLGGFNLFSWIYDNFVDVIKYNELDDVNWAGVPHGAENPRLLEIDDLVAANIVSVNHKSEDIYAIYCNIAFVGIFCCQIPFSAPGSIINAHQIEWEEQVDEIWTNVGIRAVGTFALRIDLNVNDRSVVFASAVSLEHWASYEEIIEHLDEHHEEIRSFI